MQVSPCSGQFSTHTEESDGECKNTLIVKNISKFSITNATNSHPPHTQLFFFSTLPYSCSSIFFNTHSVFLVLICKNGKEFHVIAILSYEATVVRTE